MRPGYRHPLSQNHCGPISTALPVTKMLALLAMVVEVVATSLETKSQALLEGAAPYDRLLSKPRNQETSHPLRHRRCCLQHYRAACDDRRCQ